MVKGDAAASRTRRSPSGEMVRAIELARIARMTPRERILLALRLGRRARLLESWTGPRGDRA